MPPTPRRPWSPLTDLQWHALAPYVLPRSPAGRRTEDLRARMDAIFHLALTPGDPWRSLPERFGKPETVARHFRRLTHAGLWHRLLEHMAHLAPTHPLRGIEYAICRATRRTARLGGLALLVLVRRLGFRMALNGPPWLLPDPDLSESCARSLPRTLPTTRKALAEVKSRLRSLAWLARAALGRRRIRRSVRLAWA